MTWPAGPSASMSTWCRFGSAATSVLSMAWRPSCWRAASKFASIAWIPLIHSFSVSSAGMFSKARARLSIAGKMDSSRWMFACTRISARSSSVRRLKFWKSAIVRFAASIVWASSSSNWAIRMSRVSTCGSD